MKNKKYLLISLLALIVTVGFSYDFINSGDLKVNGFKANVLASLNDYVFGVDKNSPDVGITNVYVTKLENPKKDFPYYRYKATVSLRNYGGVYDDASLILNAGERQKTAFVRNSIEGFKLGKGEIFVFEDYELLVDAKANYGKFTFELESKNHGDNNPDNNSFIVDVFEEPARLGTLSVKDFDGKNVALESLFDMDSTDILDNSTKEICSFDTAYTDVAGEGRYAETDTVTDVFSYYKFKTSKDLLLNENLNCEKIVDVKSGEEFGVKYSENRVYFLMANVGDSGDEGEDGNEGEDEELFAFSNAVYLPRQEFMTKQEFAKLFIELAEVAQTSGNQYYSDVDSDSKYAPYIQTMYDNGLTYESMQLEDKSFSFDPEKVVTRADVLEPLLNYFDIDLVEGDGAPHFSDVKNSSRNYYFVEAIYADGKGHAFSQKFSPEKKASTEFLKYLINEFKDE